MILLAYLKFEDYHHIIQNLSYENSLLTILNTIFKYSRLNTKKIQLPSIIYSIISKMSTKKH